MRRNIRFLKTIKTRLCQIALDLFVPYPDPHRSSDGYYYSRSGDVIHPQLRCGSGYETSDMSKALSTPDEIDERDESDATVESSDDTEQSSDELSRTCP